MNADTKRDKRGMKQLLSPYPRSSLFLICVHLRTKLLPNAAALPAARDQTLDLSPRLLGNRPRAFSGFDGIRARSVALQRARGDALQNPDQAKHVEGHVVLELLRRQTAAPDAATVHGDVFGFARNAERG